MICCGRGEVVKSLAIYEKKLYVPFLDGHMVALDITTGQVVWDHVIVGPTEAAMRLPGPMDSSDAQHFLMVADGGPIVAKGEVIVGLAGCSNEYKGGCFIVGLNAETGHEDWRFNTIARPGQPGGNSWNGAPVDQRFGASIWFPGSYDPDLDLVYFGTGQTYKISTLLSPREHDGGTTNDALYTDSTLALRPENGQLAWYFQHFKADVWDLDWAFEQTLVTLPIDGKLSGDKSVNPAFMPSSNQSGFGFKGLCSYARDEPSTAFDPVTKIMYVPALSDSCPNSESKYGRLEAVNLMTKKVVWVQHHRSAGASSLLVTAGGLVFDGSLDRHFRVSDAATGKVLWETRLDNPPKSTPVTYTVNGKQYVALVAGGQLQDVPNSASESDTPSTAETLWILGLPGVTTYRE